MVRLTREDDCALIRQALAMAQTALYAVDHDSTGTPLQWRYADVSAALRHLVTAVEEYLAPPLAAPPLATHRHDSGDSRA